jgi:hypothetical protein
MNILPNEIISQIAGELKGKDIVNFFLSSKRFYSICDDVFWKNKIFKEFPQNQICENLKKQYLKNFFGFFTLILMESSHSIDISIKGLFECNVDILMTNYSTDREEALSTIKKDLLPTICSINYPEINVIFLSLSYLLKYNDSIRLLDGSTSQHTDCLSNSISSKEFLSIKNINKEYYKYTIFGKRVKCGGSNSSPRNIYAFIVSYTYLWFDDKCCKTLTETNLIFLDFFETRDDIIEFVNGCGIRSIISDFRRIDREKNILKNGDEYGYIISRLPLHLKEKNKVSFDTDILFDKYHRQTNFEIIEMPLENRKTLKSKHYRPEDTLFNSM